jgi:signal transduction histidine kinase
MLIGLWDVFPHGILLAWYLAMQVIAIPHLIICMKYSGRELDESQVRFIKSVFIFYALASSTQWGSLTWLLTAEWGIHSFIVLLPLLGIFAGAINTAAILPIYFCLITPIMLQSLYVLIFTEASHPLIAGLFVIYYAGMIKFSVELHKMLVRTYSMQFELATANSELVLQTKAAEKANVDKSRFLAAASHDLRQPLYAMELFLGGLTQDSDINNTKQRYLLSRLRYALDGMRNMFSSLLDMSRFDAGVITPELKDFSANMLMNTLKYKFGEEFEKKGLKFVIRPCDHWIYSDQMLVQRVL